MRTLRQLWQLVKHQKLYTFIYLFGTALALVSVTIYAVQLRSKIAPVYPEYDRWRMAEISSAQVGKNGTSHYSQSSIGYRCIRDYFSKVENAEKKTVIRRMWGDSYAQSELEGIDIKVKLCPTDEDYFSVFTLDFLAGGPFTAGDSESGAHVAAIDSETARGIFGATDPQELIGREISVNFVRYRVCGVFRPMSATVKTSYANVLIPYKSTDSYENNDGWGSETPFLGDFNIVFVTDDLPALKEEVKEIVRRYNSSQDAYTVDLFGAPFAQYSIANGERNGDIPLGKSILTMVLTLLVLLMVPALNLGGMVAGRMEGRLSEIAVRKSYGASDKTLLNSLLWENLILTVVGAAAGFLCAYLLLRFGVVGLNVYGGTSVAATDEMIVSPAVFFICFLVCLVLNVASALFPAWRALRRPIVQSLKER